MTTNQHNPGAHGEHRDGDLDATRDAHLDANLRALGGRVGAMPAPSAARIRTWRGDVAGADSATLRLADSSGDASPALMFHPRRSRWLAAGSAVAACIAIGTVLVFQPWGATVQASTIINGLRNKTFGGVNLRFDHVSSRGTTVDGFMRVRLNSPVSIETLDDAHALDGKDHFGAAYGKFTITADESVPGWAGGRIEAEGAITHGSGWMYLLASDRTVKQLAAAEPRATGIAHMAGTGVLLNIGGVDDSFFEGLNTMMCPAGCVTGQIAAPGLHAGVRPTPDGHHRVSVGISAIGKGGPDGQANPPSMEQMQRFTALARMLLSGKARQGELDQMRSMIQNDFAQHATVQKLSGDRYLLTADLPDPEAPGSSPGATLKICYEESLGVQWAQVTNIREATGTIRVDFDSDPIDPALLQYGRLVETGKTNYLDLRRVMQFFMPVDKQLPGLLSR